MHGYFNYLAVMRFLFVFVLFVASSTASYSLSSLKHIPHSFTKEKAALIFRNDEKRHWLSPIRFRTKLRNEFGSSLKKVLVPFFGGKCSVRKVNYIGEYAVQTPTVTVNHKGEVVRTYINVWHPCSGFLPDLEYTEKNTGMKVYGGSEFHGPSVEKIFDNQAVTADPNLQTFDKTKYSTKDNDIDIIDPLVRPSEVVRRIFHDRIYSAVKRRAQEDLNKRICWHHTRILNVQFEVADLELSQFLLPVFVLKDIFSPNYDAARYLSGCNPLFEVADSTATASESSAKSLVVGPRDVSVVKTMALGALLCALHYFLLSSSGKFTQSYTALVTLMGLTARFWKEFQVFFIRLYRSRQQKLDEAGLVSDEDKRLTDETTLELEGGSGSSSSSGDVVEESD